MEKKKKGICRFFAQNGNCIKGNKCEFEHVKGGGGYQSGNWSNSGNEQASYSGGSSQMPYYSHTSGSSYKSREGGHHRGRGGYGGNKGGYGGNNKEGPKYCRGFQRGECTNLQHTNHILPQGIERKTILELDQGQVTEHRETIGIFNVNVSQFGACTDNGILSIWDNSFNVVSKLNLGIPCTAVACFSTPSATLLVFGSFFQTAPPPNQYGICVTDGNNGMNFPVTRHVIIG